MSSMVETGGVLRGSAGSYSGSGPTSLVPKRPSGTFGGDLAFSSILVISVVVTFSSPLLGLGSCLMVAFFLNRLGYGI